MLISYALNISNLVLIKSSFSLANMVASITLVLSKKSSEITFKDKVENEL